MATAQLAPTQSVLLHNVSWQTYETLLKEFDERPIRLTYDQGDLEIMTLSHGHENYAELIGRLILALTEELDMPIHSGGSTTLKRKLKQRGLEPDKCYWIKNEPLMRGRKDFDPEKDPPPDLATEVDITHSSLDRMAIYAGLRIPEVWRFDGESLLVYRLTADGKYRLCKRSPTFPYLPLDEVLRFLRESDQMDETTLVQLFRRWVREHILPALEGGQRGRSAPPKSRRRRSDNDKKRGE
jgi:Uma2 family endonuclease